MQKAFLRHKIFLIPLGLLSSIIFLEITIRLGGFVFSYLQESRNLASIRQKGAYRIMCLGESMTAGGEDPYPSQLEEVLNQRNIGIKFSVINKGVNSINTKYILSHLEENINRYKPDMVIAMMGNNDMGIKYYEGISDSNTVLFNKFRTYRLIRIMWKDFMDKLKKAGFYKPKGNKRDLTLTANIPIKKSYAKERIEFPKTDQVVKKTAGAESWDLKAHIVLGKANIIKEESQKEALKKTLSIHPNDETAYNDLGYLYNKERKFQEAEDAFRKAIELNPNNGSSYTGLGYCYNSQRKFQEAEEAFKKAIELNPNNEATYIGLGSYYNNQGRFQEAEEAFRKAIELSPNNGRGYIELGYCYNNQGRFQEAEEAFRKAIELKPDNARAYMGIGVCYSFQERLKEAEESFNKALKLDPENYQLYFSIGNNYKEQGRYLLAEEMFKEAVELNPSQVEAYVELIFLYRDYLRELELANNLFDKALALNSTNSWVHHELGRFYKDRHEYDKAEKLFKKAITLDPRDSEACFRLGEIYSEQGKYILAEDFFNKAIESDPKKEKAYGGLITVYKETGKAPMGKFKEALNNLRQKPYGPLTRANYHKAKEILDKRGIKLVCMQYPMRSMEKLKKMFELKEQERITFVDNEKIFKDALKNARSRDYFLDLFSGDFGHCTHKGNRLIAENLANVILKEVFHK